MNERKPNRVAQVLAALGKSACYVGLFLGMQVLLVLPLSLTAAVLEEMGSGAQAEQLYNLLYDNLMAFSALSGVLTLAVVLLFYLIRRKPYSEALWLRRVDRPTLFTGAALAPGLYVVVSLMLSALPESWMENYNEASADIGSGTLMGVVAVALVAPVVEEVIFRGLIMTRLSRVMPGWLAIVLSAAVFGACHGELVWFCYAFVLGVVFARIDLQAGSIWPSILAHIAFNSISQILSVLPDDDEVATIAIGVLILAAIIAPILDRRGIAALFRPAPKAVPAESVVELPPRRGNYDYDPWDE